MDADLMSSEHDLKRCALCAACSSTSQPPQGQDLVPYPRTIRTL